MDFEKIVSELGATQKSLSLNISAQRIISELPNSGGIYAFWWKNETESDKQLLRSLNRQIFIKGKRLRSKNKEIPPEHMIHRVDWNWNLEQKFVCLYVGKSSDIAKRVKQHLGFGHGENWYDVTNLANYKVAKAAKYKDGFLLKWDTACQLRAGIEHLLSTAGNNYRFFDSLQKHIYFSSFTKFNEDTHVAMTERFYSEDLAIGTFRPWFNVDSER